MGGLSNGEIGGIIGGVVGGIAILMLLSLRIYLSRLRRRRGQRAEGPKESLEPGEQYNQRVQKAENQDERVLSGEREIREPQNQDH
jgi:hypothetical protein